MKYSKRQRRLVNVSRPPMAKSTGGERSRHLRAGAVGGDAERGGVGPDAATLLELQREA